MNQNRNTHCLNVCQCFIGMILEFMINKLISKVHNLDSTGPKLAWNFSLICSIPWFCKIQTPVTIQQIVKGLNIIMSIGKNFSKDFWGVFGTRNLVHNFPRRCIKGPYKKSVKNRKNIIFPWNWLTIKNEPITVNLPVRCKSSLCFSELLISIICVKISAKHSVNPVFVLL